MVTLSELVDQLTALVGDNTVFFTLAEKKDAINEAIAMWQLMVGQVDGQVWDVQPSDSSRYYPVPKQILSPTIVRAGGRGLMMTSFPELDYGDPSWEDTTVNPQGTPVYWFPNGISEVGVAPQPSGTVLNVRGLDEAPFMRVGGDIFPLEEDDIEAILLYAHHYLSFKEGGAELNATLENVTALVQAAIVKNDELLTTRLYRKYQGLVREESERPVREGTTIYGARGTSATNVPE